MSTSQGLLRVTVSAILAVLSLVLAPSAPNSRLFARVGGQPVIHIVPNLHENYRTTAFLETCLNINDWPKVRSQTKAFGITDGSGDGVSDGALASCFSNLNSYSLELTNETGILGAFTDGTAAFNHNRQFWDRFIGLGGPLTVLYLQEPLTSGQLHTSLTYGQIVSETAEWIALVRSNYPGMKLYLQEAYPHNSSSTIIGFISDVNAAAIALGVPKLDGFSLDGDIQHGGWNWNAVADIRNAVGAASMDLSIIIWGAGPQPGSNCDWVMNAANLAEGYGGFRDFYA